MTDFTARMSLKSALKLYLFLEAREEDLEDGAEELYSSLRAYLYDNLSIQDMEKPLILLQKLEED